MPVQEQLNIIFQLLQAGRSIPIEEVVEIVPDVAGTGLVTQGTTEVAILGNGTATEVTSLVVDSTATEVSSAGVGLLAMDVGVVGAAIAPALGILAGVGLYNLTPAFWTDVSNRLLDAGQTIGGKVRAFINGDTKELGFTKETIEIFKEAFINAGFFEKTTEYPEYSSGTQDVTINSIGIGGLNTFNIALSKLVSGWENVEYTSSYENFYLPELRTWLEERSNHAIACIVNNTDSTKLDIDFGAYYGIVVIDLGAIGDTFSITDGKLNLASSRVFYIGTEGYINRNLLRIGTSHYSRTYSRLGWLGILEGILPTFGAWGYAICDANATNDYTHADELQEGAIYPSTNPFPEIYPSWNPWSVPVEGFPDVYPIEVPAINPEPDQQQAQTPQEIPDNDPNALEWLIETLPQPDPNPNPYPEPVPSPDPDPAPEPEPIPEPEPEPTPDNPVDPNPDPTPSPLPVVPDMPETVESNAMFTVYKPSMSQVNAFGGWLWSSSIVEAIKRIWQNPLDGIISFMKVYVDAPTSGSDTIKVGILDSEVSSPVVSRQFVTVECGSLNVREKFYNATDYSPFVAMHLYLPFIGIVELDIDEFMNGEIKVTYHVDVYTGTCLAEVKSRRSPDMPEWTIVYTFSGNSSQQLPLTSAEFSGALSSLVGVVGGGLAIASGGGLGLLAGASGIAHAVSHEMVHLAHSGSLSANAGIMGARKPYLILTRRRGYDANGYNALYGYPSNKTVYLNNCSGYVKVKDILLETSASDDERIEIENLLKAGVII